MCSSANLFSGNCWYIMLFVMKYGIVIIKIKRKNDSRVFNQILHSRNTCWSIFTNEFKPTHVMLFKVTKNWRFTKPKDLQDSTNPKLLKILKNRHHNYQKYPHLYFTTDKLFISYVNLIHFIRLSERICFLNYLLWIQRYWKKLKLAFFEVIVIWSLTWTVIFTFHSDKFLWKFMIP